MPKRPTPFRPFPKRPTPSEVQRGTAAERGYNHRWQLFRLSYLGRHPLCVKCLAEGRTTEATDVDHLDGRGPLGPRGYDESNLQALCHSHHSQKTATETQTSEEEKAS